MNDKTVVNTADAPAAIGPYSQAIKAGDTVYISGQIPLDPETMKVVEGGFEAQTIRVLDNLSAIVTEAGGTMDQLVKLTVLLSDLSNFPQVNEIMPKYFTAPYPARAAYAVKALPLGVDIEIEAVLFLG